MAAPPPSSASPASAAASPLPRAVREFLRTEAASGALLFVAALAALIWANSPWDGAYADFWATEVSIEFGSIGFHGDLRGFVNEGLMALFFLVVGLEVKRELVVGELRQWRTAALPAFAAAGGMIVPALVYIAIAGGGPDSRGWGIPMATDIAFVLGLAGLLGRRVPQQLRLFLLTLAIVDDVGAIVVIAVVYSEGVEGGALFVAAGLVAAFVALRRAGVSVIAVDVTVGVGLWLALHNAGVHPTLAGVVMGLLAPARPATAASVAKEWADDLSDDPAPAELRTMTAIARSAQPAVDRIAHALHPLTSWLVVPLFGLANAGVVLSGGLNDPSGPTVALAVGAGLVLGKLVGITAASAVAVRWRLGQLPSGVAWGHVVGGAALAGIGFTVSLFIADLAFEAEELVNAAKLGILGGSAVASLVGAALLVAACRRAATTT